jgi:ABC-type phosphate transport system substrate-binding protein
MRVIHKAAAVGATIVALVGISAGAAVADPYAPPASTSIVGVGSDTITPLFDGGVNGQDPGTLVTDYNTQTPAPANLLWSWDAVNAKNGTTITPKAGCASITRPNGSSAGITALNLNAKDSGGGQYCLDYARSSRAPKAVVSGTNGPDAFVELWGDAISVASPIPGTGETSPEPAALSVPQLTDIYNCTDTNWDQVGGTDAPIVPVLPQSGSGTLATFLAALGNGPNNPLVPGPCVVNGSNASGPIEENTGVSTTGFGNTAQFDPGGVPAVDDIFPYSIGDWIAQGANEGTYNGKAIGGHITGNFQHGVLKMYDTTDSNGKVQSPFAIDNTGLYSEAKVINPSFTAKLDRNLYAVVRNSGTSSAPAFPTSPTYEANALPKIFGPTGWICTNTTAQADAISYGFLLRAKCGSLSAGS